MKNLIFGIFILLIFGGCKEQKIPAFVTINNFTLVGNPTLPNSVEGYLTSNITNVLVYVNGNNLGYYELPIRIPILEDGSTKIKLYPAVEQNGIGGTIIDYPFYLEFDTTLILVAEGEYEISPITMYKTNIGSWIMDFEGATSLNSQPNSVVDMLKIGVGAPNDSLIVYGNGCGYLHLEGSDSLWNARTNSFVNPTGRVWMELDYRITNSILNTFIAGNSQGADEYPFLFINRSAQGSEYWKKIYIDLTENVTALASANYYEAGFTAILDEDLVRSDIYFDNIKILYFP